jgi:hypothetical protein
VRGLGVLWVGLSESMCSTDAFLHSVHLLPQNTLPKTERLKTTGTPYVSF